METIKTIEAMKVPGYQPGRLLDRLIRLQDARNDAGLARVMGVHPAVVSKLRSSTQSISGDLLIRMHDMSGMSINEMRELAGIPRYHFEQLEGYGP